jgi:hypothetical protein
VLKRRVPLRRPTLRDTRLDLRHSRESVGIRLERDPALGSGRIGVIRRVELKFVEQLMQPARRPRSMIL